MTHSVINALFASAEGFLGRKKLCNLFVSEFVSFVARRLYFNLKRIFVTTKIKKKKDNKLVK